MCSSFRLLYIYIPDGYGVCVFLNQVNNNNERSFKTSTVIFSEHFLNIANKYTIFDISPLFKQRRLSY